MADVEVARRIVILTFDVPPGTDSSVFDIIPFLFRLLIFIPLSPFFFIFCIIAGFLDGIVGIARFLFEGDAEFEAETRKRFTIGEEDQVRGGETVVAPMEDEVVSLGDILAGDKGYQDVSFQNLPVQNLSAQDTIDKIASGGGFVEYVADQVPQVNSVGSGHALEGDTNGTPYPGEPGEGSAWDNIGSVALVVVVFSLLFG